MEHYEYIQLKEEYKNFVERILDTLRKQGSDDFLYEIRDRMRGTIINDINRDAEKEQVILAILQSKDPNDIQEINSYLKHSRYGWVKEEYKFYNRCHWSCRKNWHIDNTPEMTERAFAYMDYFFLHKEYGAITTYLFGYCIAALFSSRMKEAHMGVPYFLQIACKRNSNVYKLVHEIVCICDVNTGLFDHCDMYDYRVCHHDHLVIYPSGTEDKLLETLLYYRDIPVVVEGYENEKLYEMLIREVANVPNRVKKLGIKKRFDILPVFITPKIQSRFRNVFSIDLTELDIENEYIEAILESEQWLGSWALELVTQAKEYFAAKNSTFYHQDIETAKIIESRELQKVRPLFYDFKNYIHSLQVENNCREKLASQDIRNIEYLSYFLSYYMEVFRDSIRLTHGTPFTYRKKKDKYIPAKLIDLIVKRATYSLLQLHSVCSPVLSENIDFEIDSSDKKKNKRIEQRGESYAKDIAKFYQSYKVNIRISGIQYKDERYVFGLRLLPGTDAKLLSRYAEEVRRLLEVEIFVLDITSAEMKLVVSEKAMNENSLIKILESDQFKKSKMEIPYAVGYDILGEMVIADIAEFPHLLVGGTSGSGKSSALHNLLMSIVYKQPASKVKLLLFDLGSSDLKIFDKVPHMLQSTLGVGEVQKAYECLRWLQMEMERRLDVKDSLDKRRFDIEFKKWASIICVIDEFPAFIRQLTTGRYNTNARMIIEDILARARKVKIHLVLATQNASKGNIKIEITNLAASMAFRCTSWHDSYAIIGSSDAVNLYGKGAMYFRCSQFEGLKRIQGALMYPNKIMDILDNMDFINNNDGKQYDEVIYQSNIVSKFENSENNYEAFSTEDEEEKLLLDIVKWMQDKECISNNQLKHNFEMGYDRANRFLARLEDEGLISAQKKGTKLARIIERDKVEKFLKRHRGTAWEQVSDITNRHIGKEIAQEQSIGVIAKVPDIQGKEEYSKPALSQSKSKQCKKINSKLIKEIKDHDKEGKKRPAH